MNQVDQTAAEILIVLAEVDMNYTDSRDVLLKAHEMLNATEEDRVNFLAQAYANIRNEG